MAYAYWVLQTTQTVLVFLSDFLGHYAHLALRTVGVSAACTSRSSAV